MQAPSLRQRRWMFRLGALLCGLGTVFAVLLLFAAVSIPLTIGSTIQHSRQILQSFEAAEKIIAAYQARTGKLDVPQLNALVEKDGYTVQVIDPELNNYDTCCQEAVAALGKPPRGSYLLEVWRGEWSEYYAPWSGRSTLTFDPDDYSTTGSLYLDVALAALIAVFLAYATIRLWKAGRSSSETKQG